MQSASLGANGAIDEKISNAINDTLVPQRARWQENHARTPVYGLGLSADPRERVVANMNRSAVVREVFARGVE